jgi:thiamine biosynthesis lipoprotein
MDTAWALVGPAARLAQAEAAVHDAEARLSRFRPGSVLARLNVDRAARDPLLAEAVRRALTLRSLTGGAFDPAIGAAVIAAGYDRSFGALPPVVQPGAGGEERPTVEVDGDRVALHGPGVLDLGGIGKGLAVDRAAAVLGPDFLVDGGGDVRCGGRPRVVGVPGGRAVRLVDGAVATSSTRKRRWRTPDGAAHHVIDPRTSAPSAGPTDAVVVAPDAATADALATALLADVTASMPALAAVGAEALVRQGGWWMTPGMEGWLR